MGEAQPTPADYEAADEFLELYRDLIKPEERNERREVAARFHFVNGDDSFRVCYGFREPETHFDHFRIGMYESDGTDESFERLVQIEAERELDAAMIQEVYTECIARLGPYGRVVRTVLRYRKATAKQRKEFDCEDVYTCIENVCRPLALCPHHFDHVSAFAKDARIENGMDLVRHGRFHSTAAIAIVGYVIDYLRSRWEMVVKIADDQGIPQEDRPDAVGHWFVENLKYANVHKLVATLEQELLIAQRWLWLVENDDEGDKSQATNASAVPEAKRKEPLFSVTDWSQLSIGVDEQGCWAVTTSPEFGSEFLKRDAIRLNVPGDQWKELMTLLASSVDGHTVDARVLMIRIEAAKAKTGLPDVRGTKVEDIVAAYRAELPNGGDAVITRAGEVASELSRTLRDYIRGPLGSGVSAISFSRKSGKITTRFTVRALVSEERGHFRFGEGRTV